MFITQPVSSVGIHKTHKIRQTGPATWKNVMSVSVRHSLLLILPLPEEREKIFRLMHTSKMMSFGHPSLLRLPLPDEKREYLE